MNFDDISGNSNPIEFFSPRAFDVRLEQIRLIQTHISWIVLAGNLAFKLKKPVAFPFLDYSSLKNRQDFCRKEMERNKAWAASLYIDIAGLHGEKGDVTFGAPTSDVEWCLRMHQFDQDDCLLRHAEKGIIPREWIDDLAQHLLQAHASARRAGSDSPWGTALSLRKQIDQCFSDIHLANKKMGLSADVPLLDREIQSRLNAFESMLEQRKREGFVRECHGDLHLGNLIRWQDHTVGFDAIEFNPDFYWIDIWNEVAFTLMDLDWRGQKQNAARLRNAYAEGSGDYAGLELLPVFTAYRALVRARIAALRIHQTAQTSDVAYRSLDEMRGYYRLSQTYLQVQRPKLWITHGLSGSGKSRGSERCIEKYGAIRIRTDVERKRLAGIDRLQVGTKEIYSPDFTLATYDRCIDLARIALKAGYSVVLDGTFLKRWQRELAYGLAREYSTEIEILDFDAPVQLLKDRISNRKADPSDATLEVLEQQIASRESLTDEERCMVQQEIWFSRKHGSAGNMDNRFG